MLGRFRRQPWFMQIHGRRCGGAAGGDREAARKAARRETYPRSENLAYTPRCRSSQRVRVATGASWEERAAPRRGFRRPVRRYCPGGVARAHPTLRKKAMRAAGVFAARALRRFAKAKLRREVRVTSRENRTPCGALPEAPYTIRVAAFQKRPAPLLREGTRTGSLNAPGRQGRGTDDARPNRPPKPEPRDNATPSRDAWPRNSGR